MDGGGHPVTQDDFFARTRDEQEIVVRRATDSLAHGGPFKLKLTLEVDAMSCREAFSRGAQALAGRWDFLTHGFSPW